MWRSPLSCVLLLLLLLLASCSDEAQSYLTRVSPPIRWEPMTAVVAATPQLTDLDMLSPWTATASSSMATPLTATAQLNRVVASEPPPAPWQTVQSMASRSLDSAVLLLRSPFTQWIFPIVHVNRYLKPSASNLITLIDAPKCTDRGEPYDEYALEEHATPTPSSAEASHPCQAEAPHIGTLAVFLLQKPASRFVYLWAHGNGEMLNDETLQNLTHLSDHSGMSVASFDYSGYGLSTGTPSEAQTYLDIETMVAWLERIHGYSKEQIVLAGRSLGTGVIMHMAQRYPHQFHHLVLVSPFLSIGQCLFLPFPLGAFDMYRNDLAMLEWAKAASPAVHRSVLLVTAVNDAVTWKSKALALLAMSGSQTAEPCMIPDAGHVDVLQSSAIQCIIAHLTWLEDATSNEMQTTSS